MILMHLLPHIRVCSRHRYEYIIPTFVFDPMAYRDRAFLERQRQEAEHQQQQQQAQQQKEDSQTPQKQQEQQQQQQEEGVEQDDDGVVSVGTDGSNSKRKADGCIGGEENDDGGQAKKPREGDASSNEPATAESKQGTAISATAAAHGAAAAASIAAGAAGPSATAAATENTATTAAETAVPGTAEAAATSDAKPDPNTPPPKQPALVAGTSSAFKFDDAAMKRLNELLGLYVGTHLFHNYTVKVSPKDPAAKRYMVSFAAEEVVELRWGKGGFRVEGEGEKDGGGAGNGEKGELTGERIEGESDALKEGVEEDRTRKRGEGGEAKTGEKVGEGGSIQAVRCVVVGQSFMLHQIRKMIGMVIAVMRGHAPEEMLTNAFRR